MSVFVTRPAVMRKLSHKCWIAQQNLKSEGETKTPQEKRQTQKKRDRRRQEMEQFNRRKTRKKIKRNKTDKPSQ
jgi:hypothetical protein